MLAGEREFCIDYSSYAYLFYQLTEPGVVDGALYPTFQENLHDPLNSKEFHLTLQDFTWSTQEIQN